MPIFRPARTDQPHRRLKASLNAQLSPITPLPSTLHADDQIDSETSLWAADSQPSGMPADRQARLAARRAFVSLKLSFLYVVEGLEGYADLKRQVRKAETPDELWLLRAPVFVALSGDDSQQRSRRQLLNRSLETMFPAAAVQLN